jgi:enoyl-CoA hydratase/carnithine racemase
MPDDVTYERTGAAAVLTIDRQERRNAVDGPTAALLAGAMPTTRRAFWSSPARASLPSARGPT